MPDMISPDAHAATVQRRLFGLIRVARGWAIGGAVLAGLGAAVTVAQMIAASHVVAAVHPHMVAEAAWRPALALLFALIVVRAGLAGLGEWCAGRLASHVTSHVRMQLVDRLVAIGPPGLSRKSTGAIVTATVDGVDALDAYFRRFVPQTFATALVPLLIVVAVAWIDVPSALILALTGPLIPVFMWLLGAAAAARTRQQWGALTALGAQFLDTLQGLSTLVLAGRGHAAAARLDTASERLRVTTMGVLKVAFLSGLVLELAATLGTALVAVGVGVRMLEGWIAFQPGLAVLLLAPEFYLPFRRLGQQHHAGMEGAAAAASIFALLDEAESGTAKAVPSVRERRDNATSGRGESSAFARSASADRRSLGGGWSDPPWTGAPWTGPPGPSITLSCDGLSFTYPGSAAPALTDVTMTCAGGTLTAIVGPSGAGKSTLASLLLRFLEPDAGRIHANGVPVDAWTAPEWRRFVSVVPQQPHFFEGSVLDNLRMAKPHATLAEVSEAAQMAEADAFIVALPDGYETSVGEAAARLSHGERQRLAIARALLKGAPVLVLDEPTSSLDPASEAAITRVVASIARTRTVIVIAHRLATVRHADQIVVLREGRIVERGRHEDLLHRHGLYSTLVHAPAPIEEVA